VAKTNAAARRQEALVAAIKPRLSDIIAKQIDLAAQGDPAAAKLVLGYWAAMPTAPEKTISLPALKAATLVQKVEGVLAAVADGVVGPSTAEALMKSIEVLSKAVALEDFASRLAALERGAAAKPGALPVAPRVEPPALA
jgi:hypothetical protein